MIHKTQLDVWTGEGGTREFRGSCPCGWEGEWTRSWRDATREIDKHELATAALAAKHSNHNTL